jgi:hypothetical protein
VRALNKNFAHSYKLFNLLIEQVATLGRNYLKLARALTRGLDALARTLEFCFQLRHLMPQLGHLMFEFFIPLGPFSRGIG